ncbi:MAG: DUF4292 domain-containing protein [Chitinophagaceae bacterium]
MNRFFLAVATILLLFSSSSCNLYHALGGHWKNNGSLTTVPTHDSGIVKIDSEIARAIIPKTPVSILPSNDSALKNWLPLWQKQTNFSSFSTKAKSHFEGKGEDHDFTANIRILKDQKIWVSITALGLVEIARALITPDTIMAIDRYHKTAYVLPFSEADKLLPFSIDFKGLQSLLLGDVLASHNNPNRFHDSDNTVSLSFSDGLNGQMVVFSKADSSLINQYLVAPNTQVAATYSNFTTIGGRKIAQERLLNILNAGVQQTLQMTYDKIEFDKDLQMSFSIPAKYERK